MGFQESGQDSTSVPCAQAHVPAVASTGPRVCLMFSSGLDCGGGLGMQPYLGAGPSPLRGLANALPVWLLLSATSDEDTEPGGSRASCPRPQNPFLADPGKEQVPGTVMLREGGFGSYPVSLLTLSVKWSSGPGGE